MSSGADRSWISDKTVKGLLERRLEGVDALCQHGLQALLGMNPFRPQIFDIPERHLNDDRKTGAQLERGEILQVLTAV